MGMSIDLSPGMRLRIENSLPISPDGISSVAAHPSSFAGPTYLYFHALSGAELCDSGASPQSSHQDFLCMHNENRGERERKTYLSPNSGLTRLGIMQYRDSDTVKPPTGGPAPASSLIDLFERTNVGEGAQRYWRLWVPVQRDTDLSVGHLGDSPGGSPENKSSTPMLFSAENLKDLASINFGTPTPCERHETTAWTCHSLHYRVVPVPEIAVWVNGSKQWVPIGSTLLDVVAERLHDGFAARWYHFSSGINRGIDHDSLADEVGGQATRLGRAALSGVKVSRYYRDGLYRIGASELETDIQVARFLRLQLLPGDQIKWQ